METALLTLKAFGKRDFKLVLRSADETPEQKGESSADRTGRSSEFGLK